MNPVPVQEWAKQLEPVSSLLGPFVPLGQSGWVVLAKVYGLPAVKVVELSERGLRRAEGK